eukprot:1766185-Lingulodinium_polyedra.AAC.1
MWDYPPLQRCLLQHSATRHFTYMGCFGHDMCKPTVIWSSLPILKRLARKTFERPPQSVGLSHSCAEYYSRDELGVTGW